MWAVLRTFQRYILPPSSGLNLNAENGSISEILAVLHISTKCKDSRAECTSVMKTFTVFIQKPAIRFTKYY
jgi:hypothetical protein